MKNSSWILLVVMSLVSCTTKSLPVQSVVSGNYQLTDYTISDNWAALPQKADPSDEVPAPLVAGYLKDTTVDVFFIHPTTFTGDFTGSWNADVKDNGLNKKTDASTIRFQASAFNEFNLYAPRYQQAHIHSFYTDQKKNSAAALGRAYADVKSAFEYFLANWNQGKPIIIAAHSQGAFHAKQLVREFFEGRELENKLVAAYLIGLPVEPDYFSQLPLCEDSVQTGCYLGWRTFRQGFEPEFDSSFRNSVVVNPLTWKADSSYADPTLHKGAVLRNFNKVYYKVSDAQVHKDLLWVSRPKFPGSRLYKSKNYHIGDINLFYLNIRENLAARVRAFREKEHTH
ncbi:DUF3089 domain-containing protein [Flavihumibacter sp. UBA7668]|uniref:DUF3089 domain-containing protein n=1 Tax=Flavihumibacter sp. UBA7668 TaxID=1946542 RepID=UPI0025C276B4|nr:DUF3089 domain-containing protein [Flavihumibacter sp. UBA7668]